MIDTVLTYLCSRQAASEWVSLREISGMMGSQGLTEVESSKMMDFLKKYFVEVDEKRKRVRLSFWASELFGRM